MPALGVGFTEAQEKVAAGEPGYAWYKGDGGNSWAGPGTLGGTNAYGVFEREEATASDAIKRLISSIKSANDPEKGAMSPGFGG